MTFTFAQSRWPFSDLGGYEPQHSDDGSLFAGCLVPHFSHKEHWVSETMLGVPCSQSRSTVCLSWYKRNPPGPTWWYVNLEPSLGSCCYATSCAIHKTQEPSMLGKSLDIFVLREDGHTNKCTNRPILLSGGDVFFVFMLTSDPYCLADSLPNW